MRFKLKDIKPNPHRNIATYPINREKVAELIRSMDRTDYWGNILGRLVDGVPQIAYGHHRLVAMKEKYGPDHMVDIIIRDLGEEEMIQIMANENMDMWGARPIVDIETVHAVVQAFAENKIHLSSPDASGPRIDWRLAPSFLPAERDVTRISRYVYTAKSVMDFLGWTTSNAYRKVANCLTALQYIEEGLLKLSVFDNLSTSQMTALIEETRKARDEREAAAKAHQQVADQAGKEVLRAEETGQKAKTEEEKKAAKVAKLRAIERQKHAELLAIEQRKLAREGALSVANALSRQFRAGTLGVKGARTAALQAAPKRNSKVPPYIEDYLERMLKDIGDILFDGRDSRTQRLDEILKYKTQIDDVQLEDTARTFRALAERALSYEEQFKPSGADLQVAKAADLLRLKGVSQ